MPELPGVLVAALQLTVIRMEQEPQDKGTKVVLAVKVHMMLVAAVVGLVLLAEMVAREVLAQLAVLAVLEQQAQFLVHPHHTLVVAGGMELLVELLVRAAVAQGVIHQVLQVQ